MPLHHVSSKLKYFWDARVSLPEVSFSFKLDMECIALLFCMVLAWSFANKAITWGTKAEADPLPFFGGVTIDSFSFSSFLCLWTFSTSQQAGEDSISALVNQWSWVRVEGWEEEGFSRLPSHWSKDTVEPHLQLRIFGPQSAIYIKCLVSSWTYYQIVTHCCWLGGWWLWWVFRAALGCSLVSYARHRLSVYFVRQKSDQVRCVMLSTLPYVRWLRRKTNGWILHNIPNFVLWFENPVRPTPLHATFLICSAQHFTAENGIVGAFLTGIQ